MQKSKGVDPLLLLGTLVIAAALLTWILPAGQFTRAPDAANGRTVVVPGSYALVAANAFGPWELAVAVPQGLISAGPVIFYVLFCGGALTVVEKTGALGRVLDALVWRFRDRPAMILLSVTLLFMVGGATYSMYEEIIAFIPLLCVLMRRLGWGGVTALALSVGSSVVASSFSPVDTFHLGIAQPMAELPLLSGFAFRAVVCAAAIAIWIAYVLWHARKTRVAAVETIPVERPAAGANWSDYGVLAIMNACMASLVAGSVFLKWGLGEYTAAFLVMGLCAGLAGGLGWRGTSEAFAEGLRRLAYACVLIGFARAISVILDKGKVLDTVVNWLVAPLSSMPVSMAGVAMLGSLSAMSVPMPSDSGKALISLPVLLPVADLLGLSRQAVVIAYQNSTLISGLVTPTGGSILAMLALAGVPLREWLKFLAPAVAAMFLLAAGSVAVAAMFRLA